MEKRTSPSQRLTALRVARPAVVLLAFVFLMLSFLSPSAQAAWDGSGETSDGVPGIVSGNFFLNYADIEDVTGYRFSVYDGTGAKIGNSVDIHFKSYSASINRTYRENKKSHIDIYREYLDSGTVDLKQLSADDNVASYVYYDTSLPSTPTDVERWLTDEKAADVAFLCDAFSWTASTSYIVCEPLFNAYLEDGWYGMTLAEFAVYQSDQYGWGADGLPATWTDGTYSTIMRQLSAFYGRFLYATQTYTVFETKPVPESALKKDALGNPSVLLGSHQRYNAASDVLKYQMGMAIYTEILPSHELTIDPNGGLYNGSNSVSKVTVQENAQITVPDPVRVGYVFTGWEVEGKGTISGKTYIQGNGPCKLTATWQTATDIKYTVNHHLMSYDGKTYELNSTTRPTGTAGTTISLADLAKTFDGFTYKEGKVDGEVVTETTVLIDGSRVVDLYYSRNKYTLSLKGELDGVQTENIEGCGTIDVYINGALVADDVSSYSGEHYYGSLYSVQDQQSAFNRKYLSEDELYGHMTSDQTVILRYGSAHTLIVDPNGGLYEGKTEPTEVMVFYGDTATINNPTKTGYSFSHWTVVSGSATILPQDASSCWYKHATNGPVRISAEWRPNYSTKYTVNYRLMGLDGTTYELAETTEHFGTTGVTVPLAGHAKDRPGFAYKEGKVDGEVVTNTTILPDGSRVIDLYYSREKYEFTLKGFLDGTESDGIEGYGTVDIYINGTLVADDVSSYSGEHYFGSSYEITDIKTASGKAYNGIYAGELSGVISGNVVSIVNFSTKYKLTIDPNGGTWYHEGQAYTEPHTITVSAFTEVSIEPPTKEGQLFRQWILSNDTCSLVGEKYLHGAGNCTIVAVWAEHKYPVTALNGYTRFIKHKYLDTLEPNSKWRQDVLYSLLEKALKNNLADTSGSQQVWHFSPEDYDTVHDWCVNRDKGEQTNKDFLTEFADKNRVQ